MRRPGADEGTVGQLGELVTGRRFWILTLPPIWGPVPTLAPCQTRRLSPGRAFFRICASSRTLLPSPAIAV